MVQVNGDNSENTCQASSSDVPAQNANSIGREFVRQYYTMLCNGPKFMHRFYNNDSMFVRGETVLIGQSLIEKYIKESKQKHSHTKVRAIDAIQTIASGVVVQVVGEVSLNDQPFRYFVQSFVLAPQSPKRYYVHNDTLRYLDEVISGNICTSADRSHSSSTVANTSNCTEPVQISGHSNAQPYGDDVTIAAETSSSDVQCQTVAPHAQDHSVSNSKADYPQVNQQSSGDFSSPTLPDLVVSDHSCAAAVQQFAEESMALPMENNTGSLNENGRSGYQDDGSSAHSAANEKENARNNEEDNTGVKQAASWARVASKNASSSPVVLVIPQQSTSFIPGNIQHQAHAVVLSDQNMIAKQNMENYKQHAHMVVNGVGAVVRPYFDNSHISHGLMHGMNVMHNNGNNFRQGEAVEFQIYVGNVPLNWKDTDIKSQFSKYGNITKVSIVAKVNIPPFAFVTFDSAESARLAVENSRNLICNGNKLSVERKKPDQIRPNLYQANMNRGGESFGGYNQPRPNMNSRQNNNGRNYRNGPFTRGGGQMVGARTFNSKNSMPMAGHLHGQYMSNPTN